jgi:hypothetical protein
MLPEIRRCFHLSILRIPPAPQLWGLPAGHGGGFALPVEKAMAVKGEDGAGTRTHLVQDGSFAGTRLVRGKGHATETDSWRMNATTRFGGGRLTSFQRCFAS